MTDDEIRRHPAYKRGWDIYLEYRLDQRAVTRNPLKNKELICPYPGDSFQRGTESWIWYRGAYSASAPTHAVEGWAGNQPPLPPCSVVTQMELFE